jgi:nucleotide-binding universal stress UspA family protein
MAYRRILVPIDGSPTSRRGLDEALKLAKSQAAVLQLVHVVDIYHLALMAAQNAYGGYSAQLITSMEKAGRRILRSAEARARSRGVKAQPVLLESTTGPAADAIVRQARRWRADLIVLGTHGRRGVRRLVMGSDAEQVVRAAPVPVLLVRSR